MWVITKKFSFEASHRLPSHDGKCARLHGHSWKGEVTLQMAAELEDKGPKAGMVMDFADIGRPLKWLVDGYLDHYHLNATTELENPTCEELARWIYDKLKPGLPQIHSVTLEETCTSRCTYYGKLA